MRGQERFETQRVGALRVAHLPVVPASIVAEAIARHRENFREGREACLHWGPGSSVSRVRIPGASGAFDLAVKWNPWRGWRGALSDALHGSRGRRAVAASHRLAPTGLRHPEVLAFAERRRFGAVRESFLLTRFMEGADPLPVAMARLRKENGPRRALAGAVGELVGALHAAGLDHRDLKHSNLLVDGAGLALLDLEALGTLAPLAWRRRVRALGVLEAFARDLYPWLPKSDRARFLRGYLRAEPGVAPRERELVRDALRAAERRLARWARREREGARHFPLAPLDSDQCRAVDAACGSGEGGPGSQR